MEAVSRAKRSVERAAGVGDYGVGLDTMDIVGILKMPGDAGAIVAENRVARESRRRLERTCRVRVVLDGG